MPVTFDNAGNVIDSPRRTKLGEFSDARKFNTDGAPYSSLFMLNGKYVDADGIVYDPNGQVNEPATAAWAREVATGAFRVDGRTPTPDEVKEDSRQERADFDAQKTYLETMESNIYTTATELPARIVQSISDAATLSGPFSALRFAAIAGLLFMVLSKLPAPRYSMRDEAISYGRKRVKYYRKRAARAVSRRIAGE